MYTHACMMFNCSLIRGGKGKRPFKNKCKGSESYRGDDITVDGEHVMAHTLLDGIHGKYEHSCRAKLNRQ